MSVNIDVIQSVAKNLENILVDVFVYVTEILPPFGRLNDRLCQQVYYSLILSFGFTQLYHSLRSRHLPIRP